MFAARGGSLDLVELLLARGAQPNLKNETGATALIIAAKNNRPAIGQALLRRGAGIDATDQQGWTALMYAAKLGYGVMVRTLLNNGANPHLVNKEGMTAFMCAAQGQNGSTPSPRFSSQPLERWKRSDYTHQPSMSPPDFDEVLTLLRQAEKRQYSRRG
jgi:ankyrin repeat protein